MTGSKLGKECVKAVYCHPAYLNYMQSTSCKMLGRWSTSWNQDCQEKYQYADTDMQMTPPLWHKVRTKEPIDESEREDWKTGLKLNIQKTEIMASGPITSWQIDVETVETVTDFIFLGFKITADGDCSHN